MPVRNWKLRIEDILEAIDDIGQFIKGMTNEVFSTPPICRRLPAKMALNAR